MYDANSAVLSILSGGPAAGHFRNFWPYASSNFTVVIGQHRGEPTIRALSSDRYDRLVGSISGRDRLKVPKELLDENHTYVRNHHRAQLCFGNLLQVELRRQYRDGTLCWGLNIVIVGRASRHQKESKSYRRPTICTREMSLDQGLLSNVAASWKD